MVIVMNTSCKKENIFGHTNSFSDDFESITIADSLFSEDDQSWIAFQLTKTENFFEVDTTIAYAGKQSIRFYAVKTENGASKSSIFKNNMAMYDGQTVQLNAWYYLNGSQEEDYLFLMDLEESTPIGAGPGIRVGIDSENHLFIERKKYLEKDIYQSSNTAIEFPRNTWVKITLEVFLSKKNKGTIKLYQNNQLIIDEKKTKTLPTDFLYVIQGTAGLYTNIEFGITANSISNETILYLDDVDVKEVK